MKKRNIVKKDREFKEILELKHFYKNELFKIYFRHNSYGFTRVGLLLTKKNGNAVIRNKIKRQIRSIVDSIISYDIPEDIIIVVNMKYDVNEFSKNKEKLTLLFNTLLGELNEK